MGLLLCFFREREWQANTRGEGMLESDMFRKEQRGRVAAYARN
jgi:hypothetical protein